MLLDSNESNVLTPPRRAPWRQRLVDAETGFRVGMRADSTLFVFFFFAASIFLAALILGLTTLEWAILVLGMGMAFAAELFHQVLKHVAEQTPAHWSGGLQEVFRLGTTAVVAAQLTAASVAVILLWHRFSLLWGN